MRRPIKVVVWAVVFSGCAAAGAFVASRTDPFPPGVSDPGDRTSPTPSEDPGVSPEPGAQTWLVQIDSRTRHVFHVGGECRTTWKGTVQVTVEPGGAAEGRGAVGLVGEAECDFDVAQVQAGEIRLEAAGALVDGRLELTFGEAGRDPVGSRDLGGLADTLSEMTPSVELGGREEVTIERSDGDRGRYVSITSFEASCAGGC